MLDYGKSYKHTSSERKKLNLSIEELKTICADINALYRPVGGNGRIYHILSSKVTSLPATVMLMSTQLWAECQLVQTKPFTEY